MIRISGSDVDQIDTSTLSELERSILQKKQKSSVTYLYDSPTALLFELNMRSKIVEAAKAMNASHVSFATFHNSRANDKFWSRTDNGGFRQKAGVLTSDAINDIFKNSRLYGFECATAMVIILYKATLDSIGKDRFNTYFKDLFLYDWNYDNHLRLVRVNDKNEAYPGDVLYFENPDHNPKTPEWQGENAIMLADNLYFGHGIGIRTEEGIIASLNTNRRSGSTTSAFLSDEVEHPDFEYLRKLENPIMARIGMHTYIYRRLGS
ncbi:protein-glutamine gamma-glutamyltransferase [Paenibacillus baekrokdamisoli]|uniref:Protein-glutamine gamma-glutamyltransferase n=2 Tax=Paenibacillus baekrokdamisoli TaxID=1712516 RepID=A0A3G9J9H4_9BACL|nr:protein-glutamine gamma-glutamyltransferase [Paenibacillus baekrokdamisoli]BBH22501.1 protein-glutamine gamma-glutamyltransferase [Paenibacillus baekrokdamisoli]